MPICKFAEEIERDWKILLDELNRMDTAAAKEKMVARTTRASLKKLLVATDNSLSMETPGRKTPK